jgi:Outer membrane protein beta-barrel domain
MKDASVRSLRLRTVVALSCALLLPAAACSAEQSPRVELTPFGGYRFGGAMPVQDSDDSVQLDDAGSFGLLLDIRESDNTQWEILYSRQQPQGDASSFVAANSRLDLTLHSLQGGGTYQWDGDTARPFLAATVGATHIGVGNAGFDSDTFFSFSMGLGLQMWPRQHLGLRLELRTYGTLLNSNTDLLCGSDSAGGFCAIRIDGDILWQVEALAGVVFRF